MNPEVFHEAQRLGLTLSGSILGLPAARQVAAADELAAAGAWAHLDLIDERYPIGAGVPDEVTRTVLERIPERTDLHLFSRPLDVRHLPIESAARITLHLAPEDDVDRALASLPEGPRRWVSVEPGRWSADQVARLAARPDVDGALIMLTPPGDPRFAADESIPVSAQWAAARAAGPVGVDGGVSAKLLDVLAEAGAGYAVVGRALFTTADTESP